MTKRSCCTSFWSSFPREFNGAIYNAICIIWPKRSCFMSFQSPRSKEFSGAIYDAIGIIYCWYWCQCCRMTKSNVAPHFDHLDLKNSVVPFMIPLASCDADTNASGVTWQKSRVAPHFGHLGLRNSMASLTVQPTSCDADANNIRQKRSCCISFQSSWLKACSGTIYDVVGITWCWRQCQWCHMMEKVMFHLISIVFQLYFYIYVHSICRLQ